MIKAIETSYKGYRFRSRLEARYAVFLDTLGIEWDYEREGYDLGGLGYYLPDFWLPWHAYGQHPGAGYFLEIKGQDPTPEEVEKLKALAAGTGHTCFLLAGEIGKQRHYTAHRRGHFFYTDPAQDELLEDGDPYANHLWAMFSRWDFTGDVDNAISTARSARFEHGESPAIKAQDIIDSYEAPEKARAVTVAKICPECGAIPHVYCNRSSPMMDKWLACPRCGFSGGHDDTFQGAYFEWDKAARSRMQVSA
jgi:hypothetical protein